MMTMSVYRRSRQTPSHPDGHVASQRSQQQREQPIFTVTSPVYDEIEESNNQTNETFELSDFTSAPDPPKRRKRPDNNTPVYLYRGNDYTEHLHEETPVYVYRANDP